MAFVKSRQGAYNQHLLVDGSAKNTLIKDYVWGYQFDMGIPTYKSLYLSEFEMFHVELDGQEVPEKDITFILYNKRFKIYELAGMYKEHWDTLDKATVEIRKDGGLKGKHEIFIDVAIRMPYSAYFGECAVETHDCKKTFDFGN